MDTILRPKLMNCGGNARDAYLGGVRRGDLGGVLCILVGNICMSFDASGATALMLVWTAQQLARIYKICTPPMSESFKM